MQRINELVQEVQKVLDFHHQNLEKRKIVVTPKRLNFACPVCGDSQKKVSLKRGNIYLQNMFYVCYNCGVRWPATKFFERCNHSVSAELTLHMLDQIQEYKLHQHENQSLADIEIDHAISLKELAAYLNNNPKHHIFDFKPLEKNSEVHNYLIHERKIENLSNFWQCVFRNHNRQVHKCAVTLNRNKDILLGFQLRSINTKGDRIFKIYNFETCWNYLNNPLEPEKVQIYNKLSYLFGILNTDFNQEVTIFEGYYDATFFPNSIGLCGVDTDVSFIENSELDFRFFFDNDETGREHATEKLKAGHSVFLWKKFLENLSEQFPDPMVANIKLNEKIKDLNQIAKKWRNPYQTLNLEQYFSRDEFDLAFI